MKSSAFRAIPGAAATVAILLAVFGLYYLHVRSQIVYFDQRNLRRLATMGEQVEQTIAGYAEVVRTVYKNPKNIGLDLKEFLWNQTDLEWDQGVSHAGHPKGMHLQVKGRWLYFDYHKTDTEMVAPGFPPSKFRADKNHPNFDRQQPIAVKTDIPAMLSYFVPHDAVNEPFDVVVLADSRGQTIYQSSFPELRFGDLSKLFSNRQESQKEVKKRAVKNAGRQDQAVTETTEDERDAAPVALKAETPAASQAARIQDYADMLSATDLREVDIAGVRYKVYAQPVKLPTDGEQLHWVLCGFVRPERFNADTWSLPYPVLIGLIFLVVLVFLGQPALKVALLGRYAPLKRWDVARVAVSVALVPGLIAILGAYLYAHESLASETDAQLKKFANDLAAHFTAETGRILKQLQIHTDKLRDLGSSAQADKSRVLEVLGGKGFFKAADVPYRNFDLVFWTDHDGTQQVKWSQADYVTPFLRLTDNDGFRKFQDKRRFLTTVDGVEQEFTVVADRSPATGENLAVFGIPVGKPIKAHGKELDAAFLISRPESLFEPVLPPGVGFCIVEQSGQVLFHDEWRLNGHENLFVETDHSKDLESAVLGMNAPPLVAPYKGRNHRFYVTRFPNITTFAPLSLVVYKDEIYDETMTAEIAAVAIGLFGMYLAILTAIGLLIRLFWQPRWREWARPEAGRERNYVFLMVFEALMALIFLLLLFHLSPAALLTGAFLSAGVSIGTALWLLKWRRAETAGRAPAQRTGIFVLACLALVVNVSVLPAAALFRIAHVYESILFVHFGQKSIVEQLEDRFDGFQYRRAWTHVADEIWKQQYQLKTDARYSYHQAFFNSKLEALRRDTDDPAPKWFGAVLDPLLDFMNPRFNRIAMKARDMKTMSADHEWHWPNPTSVSTVVLHKRHYQNGQDPEQSTLTITSNTPVLLDPATWTLWGITGVAGVTLLLGVALYYGVRWLLDRVCLTDIHLPLRPALSPVVFTKNTLVLLTASDDSDHLDSIAPDRIVDMAAVIAGGKAAAPIQGGDGIGLRNFEYRVGSAEANRLRLETIERLCASGAPIAIASRIDPLFHFCVEGIGSEALERWRSVLGGFQKIVPQAGGELPAAVLIQFRARLDADLSPREKDALVALLAAECGSGPKLRAVATLIAERQGVLRTPSQLMIEVGEAAESWYASVWANCSETEKLVLHQLARYGFLNPRGLAEVQQLLRKGLIVGDPSYRCVNESFRNWLLEKVAPADVLNSVAEGKASLVPGLVGAALAGLSVVIVVAVLLGQKETLQSFFGYFTAIAGGLGTVTRVLSSRLGGGGKAQNA